MGEIRIFSPGKTRGYPYPVCKKRIVSPGKIRGYSYPVCKKIKSKDGPYTLVIISTHWAQASLLGNRPFNLKSTLTYWYQYTLVTNSTSW